MIAATTALGITTTPEHRTITYTCTGCGMPIRFTLPDGAVRDNGRLAFDGTRHVTGLTLHMTRACGGP